MLSLCQEAKMAKWTLSHKRSRKISSRIRDELQARQAKTSPLTASKRIRKEMTMQGTSMDKPRDKTRDRT
jgi:hypothetical protein